MAKQAADMIVDVQFPIKGLYSATAYAAQPQGTTADCLNVRAFDPRTGRNRGSQRSGLTKYIDATVNSTNSIQCIDHMVSSAATGTSTLSVRTIKGIVVAGGTVKSYTSAGFATITNGTTALSATTPVIFSSQLFSELYFADGVSSKYYDIDTDTMTAWTPSAGSLPASGSDRCRLITTWRGRIVMAGLVSDPQNWFMSAVNDALDWDYGATVSETMAVAGNNSDAGKVGDIINCLIPYKDDIMIFGGDHTIWQMTGDPASGGRIDLVSDTIGMAWGRPYCKDPAGVIYFFGSRGGVYQLVPDQIPQRISQAIEERLAEVNLDTTLVRMVYDDRQQGFHLFLSPLTSSVATTHYYFDIRNKAWWADQFADTDHNPKAVHIFDGDAATDRVVLLGGWDGYLRKLDVDAKDDDSTAIASHVLIGPLQMKGGESFLLKEMEAWLSDDSDTINWSVQRGDTPEEAFAAEVRRSGRFTAGRNITVRPRVEGTAQYIKLAQDLANETWALERLQAVVHSKGKVGRRAA